MLAATQYSCGQIVQRVHFAFLMFENISPDVEDDDIDDDDVDRGEVQETPVS